MSITFGGLATGMDSNAIVDQLMAIERTPITRLKTDKTWFQSRQTAYETFDGKLKSFLSSIENLGSSDDLRQKSVSAASKDFFSVTASVDALPGASYKVEVVSLAQVQKNVSQGYVDKSVQGFGTGELTLTVGDNDPMAITIDDTNNSLEGIMQAINAADSGVNASIINDGTGSPYRLMLTGADVASTFSLTSNLTTGGGYDPLSLTETQPATQAHIRVDTIDIYSDSNTLDEVISGLTLDLTQAEPGTMTSVSVSLDDVAIKSQIQNFVKGYNDVMSFISAQSASEDSSGGILGGDSGVSAVKRRLQNLLTTTVSNTGSFAALSQLGLKTQRDGTIELDDATLTAAIHDNLDSVEKILVGEGEVDGVAVQFQNYLEGMTDSIDGLFASNKESTESTIRRIDSRIEQIEMRLEKKEETMRKKFSAMEELVSGMNNQSSFLTQQLDMLTNMMTRK